MGEERATSAGYEIRSERPPFLVAELELFRSYQPLLERCAKGSLQLYLTLMSYVNHEKYNPLCGHAWPSQRLMANTLNISERQIRYCLAALRDLGLLSIQRRGLMQTNLIIIHVLPSLEVIGQTIDTFPPDERFNVYREARTTVNNLVDELEAKREAKKHHA